MMFDLNQRMIHLLMFQANFLRDSGLFSGKMGVVLFFAHYYKESSVELYENIADELMKQVLEKVHKELPIGLASGLCGIGWGIEYLIQNEFMEGYGVDICEEIDQKIMETDPRRIIDFSLETGLEGLLHYVSYHIHGALIKQTTMPFDETYLTDLVYTVNSLYKKKDVNSKLLILADNYTEFMKKKDIINYEPTLDCFRDRIEIDEKKLIDYPIGLKDGLAGALLKSIINL